MTRSTSEMPARLARISVPSAKVQKPRKANHKRALDAFSIASNQAPKKLKIRHARFGEIEDDSSRKRRKTDAGNQAGEPRPSKGHENPSNGGAQAHGDEEIDTGSDSDGNKWTLGHVEEGEDSEVDSDEAFGQSDEERFGDFVFRGSSKRDQGQKKSNKKAASAREDSDIDLKEEEEGQTDEDIEGDEGVDLATMLDMNTSEDVDQTSNLDSADNMGEHVEADSGESHSSGDDDSASFHAFSSADEAEDDGDPSKYSQLQRLIASLPEPERTKQSKLRSHDTHEAMPPSEYGITASRKLKVEDLLRSVTNPVMRKSLKMLTSTAKPSKANGIPGKLEAPLPKRQRDRLDREAANEKAQETLARWIDTVKHNRRADHLSFPIKSTNPEHADGTKRFLTESSEAPLTELEKSITAILLESGFGPGNNKSEEEQIRDAEELLENKLPLEELLARRAELRKSRELMFREEIRARRIKKIKSKAYRRVHRREREKIARQERDAFIAAGVELPEDERERLDRQRAEERMGAKHRNSKWAKEVKQSGRAAWDAEARNGMLEMALRDEELRRRIQGKNVRGGDGEEPSVHSDEDEEEQSSDEDDDSNRQTLRTLQSLDRLDSDRPSQEKGSGLSSMKFMQQAEVRLKERNNQEVEQLQRELAGAELPDDPPPDHQFIVGRKMFGPATAGARDSGTAETRNEFEEGDASDLENIIGADENPVDGDSRPNRAFAEGHLPTSKPTRHRNTADKQSKRPVVDASEPVQNPWLPASNTRSGSAARLDIPVQPKPVTATQRSKHKPVAKQSPKPQQLTKSPAAENRQAGTDKILDHVGIVSDSSDDDDGHAPVVLRNLELVKKAFAGDEVVADFEREKKAAVTEEGEKVIDTTLPGWGSWTGEGISRRERKRNSGRFFTKVAGVKAEKRKDAKLEKVIISEKRVKKNAKYMATSLPHPFETRQQYERSLRIPIGPEWTTKETFFEATKPRVMIKPHTIILPLEKPIL